MSEASRYYRHPALLLSHLVSMWSEQHWIVGHNILLVGLESLQCSLERFPITVDCVLGVPVYSSGYTRHVVSVVFSAPRTCTQGFAALPRKICLHKLHFACGAFGETTASYSSFPRTWHIHYHFHLHSVIGVDLVAGELQLLLISGLRCRSE